VQQKTASFFEPSRVRRRRRRQDGRLLHPPRPLHRHLWRGRHPTAHICAQKPISRGCSSVAVSDWNVHVVLLGVHVHDPDEPADRTRPEPKSSHRRQVLLGRCLGDRVIQMQGQGILDPILQFSSHL